MKLTTALSTILVIALFIPAAAHAQDRSVEDRLKRALERFPEADANQDGVLTRAELQQFNRKRREQPSRRQDRQRAQRARAPMPTRADVSYGAHEKQAFDLWLAESGDGKPTPLVIYIHGGGFRGGDKRSASGQPVQRYLDQGISFASMNYRLSDVGPYPMQMRDSARGLQYIRSQAKEWNLDPERIVCYGGSAGAGISLWLAFHDDLADPKSSDPVARQSTRILAAGTTNGQSTYDMRTFRKWFAVPNLEPHPALVTFYGVRNEEDWESERVRKLMTDASAITHLTRDDPPVFMTYSRGDVPVDEKSSPGLWVHHARLGLKLKQAMGQLGLECHVTWPDNPDTKYDTIHAFLADKVKGGKH